jgi:ADP-heptose:LPS heptosyltransferase
MPEQGYGDEIQFVRYVSLLKKLGASRITLMCKPALKKLFSTLYDVDKVIVSIDEIEKHDYWSFLLSLPFYLNTTLETIPAQMPYLKIQDEWINKKLVLRDKNYKVGLVWSGSSLHGNDINRSLPGLFSLAPLWTITGITYVSLQKEYSLNDMDVHESKQPMVDMGKNIEDFADTAVVISELDLVICVDTAVAHLAGALGKTCWILLPHTNSDWRWMNERNDSPWYPGTIRLFRQTTPHSWDATITEVAMMLSAYAKKPLKNITMTIV